MNINTINFTHLNMNPSLPHTQSSIQTLSCLLLHFCDTNTKTMSNTHISPATAKFSAASVPDIPLQTYLQRLRTYLNTPEEIFIVSIIYIDKLIQSDLCPTDMTLNLHTVHRLILVSTYLAMKFLFDIPPKTSHVAAAGGVSVPELVSLESIFINIIRFNLFVTPNTYQEISSQLHNHKVHCPRCLSIKDKIILTSPSPRHISEHHVHGGRTWNNCPNKTHSVY